MDFIENRILSSTKRWMVAFVFKKLIIVLLIP